MSIVRVGASDPVKKAAGADNPAAPFHALLPDRIKRCPDKVEAFLRAGYEPHLYQVLLHTSDKRFVVAGAGRRSGKTYSVSFEAAWLANPTPVKIFDKDKDGNVKLDDKGNPIILRESTVQREELARKGVNVPPIGRPIIGAVVTPERAAYPATERDFLAALAALDIEYEYIQTTGTVYLPSKERPESIVYFKGATKPERLRGDGYCWSWWDEPAFISGREAWDTFRPALAQTRGCAIFSTTPSDDDADWWFWEEFISRVFEEKLPDGRKLDPDPNVEYIEWFSYENPQFPEEEWESLRQAIHPEIFRREYMARWQRASGRILKRSWLKFFRDEDLKLTPAGLPDPDHYRTYIGIDPAISLEATADFTAAAVIAVERNGGLAYLFELIRERLDIDRQLELINELHLKYQPLGIGIEDVAYQKALVQQASRLPSMPMVMPQRARGSKEERILSMSPVFQRGRMRIRNEYWDFIDEWSSFPNGRHDDTLDACEIAIRTAGMLFGSVLPQIKEDAPPVSLSELAHKSMSSRLDPKVDEQLGAYY